MSLIGDLDKRVKTGLVEAAIKPSLTLDKVQSFEDRFKREIKASGSFVELAKKLSEQELFAVVHNTHPLLEIPEISSGIPLDGKRTRLIALSELLERSKEDLDLRTRVILDLGSDRVDSHFVQEALTELGPKRNSNFYNEREVVNLFFDLLEGSNSLHTRLAAALGLRKALKHDSGSENSKKEIESRLLERAFEHILKIEESKKDAAKACKALDSTLLVLSASRSSDVIDLFEDLKKHNNQRISSTAMMYRPSKPIEVDEGRIKKIRDKLSDCEE